jgi:site-specific DNA-cytosine methylase
MNAPISITDLALSALIMFSGSGGLSLGFERAGFSTTGMDFDPRACEDHLRLTGKPSHCVDIKAMGPADLLALHPECPDVLASSSPCVGFSGCLPEVTSKTVKYQDFNDLALHGIQLGLEAWKGAKTGRRVPGIIVFENVPRIMTRGKKLLDYMVGLLHAEGYAVEMSTHDCGELGKGLAQRRRRFLLVARHMSTVTDFLRKPPQYKPLALRDVLWELPPPRPGGKGMHVLPVLSALNHLRLAAIFAGKDWRVLPPEVYLYTCESSDLESVTGIRWEHCVGRHAGKLGVLDWSMPAKTIIGKARVCNTWNAVADPRVGWTTDGPYKDRPSSYGVASAAESSPTVRGKQLLANSAAAVDDPRIGVGLPVDARVRPDGKQPRSDGYGVQSSEEPAKTIRGRHDIWAAPASLTDPRLTCSQRSDAYGVQDPADPSCTIVGNHAHDNERGWPVPTHELVILADGRYVLYGPAVDFADKRPRADIVIRAPDGCLHRPMTDAELSRIMGFPLDFEFCGPSSCAKAKAGEAPRTGRRKRIGNAVPPPTAYAIAQEMRATLVASANGGFRLASGLVWVQPEAEMRA